MPRNSPSPVFFYVYVLESLKDKNRYVGYTNNLKKRLEEHTLGKSFATAPRRPLALIYFEACLQEQDAIMREHYLTSTIGRRFITK